ncbi:MAG: hypothetical protein V4641_13045 [Pseudomonadota bacterium]
MDASEARKHLANGQTPEHLAHEARAVLAPIEAAERAAQDAQRQAEEEENVRLQAIHQAELEAEQAREAAAALAAQRPEKSLSSKKKGAL